MATSRQGTGAKDRKVEFVNYTDGQDTYGGPTSTERERFEKWANVKDRSGGPQNGQAQEVWQYDAEVVIRYDARVTSGSIMVYSGNRYKINNLRISGEGYKKEMIMQTSKIETATNIS